MTRDEVAQLEVGSRRRVTEPGVLHPDACQKITLHGVEFAVRPLYPAESIRFVPKFDGKGEVEIQEPSPPDPALVALAEALLSAAPIEKRDACPTCGAVRCALSVDIDKGLSFLHQAAEYVRAVLNQQYCLPDDSASALLAFEGDLPFWVSGAMYHAHGMDPQSQSAGGPDDRLSEFISGLPEEEISGDAQADD